MRKGPQSLGVLCRAPAPDVNGEEWRQAGTQEDNSASQLFPPIRCREIINGAVERKTAARPGLIGETVRQTFPCWVLLSGDDGDRHLWVPSGIMQVGFCTDYIGRTLPFPSRAVQAADIRCMAHKLIC